VTFVGPHVLADVLDRTPQHGVITRQFLVDGQSPEGVEEERLSHGEGGGTGDCRLERQPYLRPVAPAPGKAVQPPAQRWRSSRNRQAAIPAESSARADLEGRWGVMADPEAFAFCGTLGKPPGRQRREVRMKHRQKSEADKGKGEGGRKSFPTTRVSSPWRLLLGKGLAELGRNCRA